ncbi:MAG: MFS transporter [Myxococcota bacterium]
MKLTPYQRRLFLFLSVATFFEGYDFLALGQILPNLREDFGLDPAWSAYIIGFVNIGTILAFFLVRKADVWGRRRVMTVTIFGYTVMTFLTGLAPNLVVFVVLQLIARIFLLAEWSVSMVYAAEEFPAEKRGTTIGVIQACSSLGSIACAGLVPLLLKSPFGWRTVYFVGIIPLILLAFARRSLGETRRFKERGPEPPPSLFSIWSSPYVKRVLTLAAVWFVAYIPAQNAVGLWKEFAVNERGLTDGEVGLAIAIAAVGSLPFLFGAGKMIDTLGRKRSSAIIFTIGGFAIVGCYTLHGFVPLTIALGFGIFGASAYLPILNSYGSELFPTQYRGTANAWANNIFGRLGYVLSPFAVGAIVGATGGEYGPVVASTAVFNIVAIALIYATMPETTNRELEDTSTMAAGAS